MPCSQTAQYLLSLSSSIPLSCNFSKPSQSVLTLVYAIHANKKPVTASFGCLSVYQ
uniref:Uncharacterized protein n=1 Tax=Arion vulgaris TaxID=1028688 RepID=A0A0B7AI98_9EUPU